MARSNYPLRLQTSLLEQARKLAAREGTSVNQFINTAVAEKIAALHTLDVLRARAARGNVSEALAILERAGSEPPRPGDEIEGGVSEEGVSYVLARRKGGDRKRKTIGRAHKRR